MYRQDIEVRSFLEKRLKDAGIEHIRIDRTANALTITITAAKPGFIIGRGGTGIEELRKNLQKKFLDRKTNLQLNIQEIKHPGLSAPIVLQGMVADIERRIPFRRVLKQAVEKVQKAGALGVRVQVAGRLNGAEIARTEHIGAGKIPLQNLRADIDYAQGFAQTIYGTIGVKVWLYRGQVFGRMDMGDTDQNKG